MDLMTVEVETGLMARHFDQYRLLFSKYVHILFIQFRVMLLPVANDMTYVLPCNVNNSNQL